LLLASERWKRITASLAAYHHTIGPAGVASSFIETPTSDGFRTAPAPGKPADTGGLSGYRGAGKGIHPGSPARAQDVRVNHRRLDVRVDHQLLNSTDIIPVFEQWVPEPSALALWRPSDRRRSGGGGGNRTARRPPYRHDRPPEGAASHRPGRRGDLNPPTDAEGWAGKDNRRPLSRCFRVGSRPKRRSWPF